MEREQNSKSPRSSEGSYQGNYWCFCLGPFLQTACPTRFLTNWIYLPISCVRKRDCVRTSLLAHRLTVAGRQILSIRCLRRHTHTVLGGTSNYLDSWFPVNLIVQSRKLYRVYQNGRFFNSDRSLLRCLLQKVATSNEAIRLGVGEDKGPGGG